MPLALKSSGGGSVTLDVPSTASTYTLTAPAKTGNIITSADSGTVTQGMIASGVAGTGPAFRAYQSSGTAISNTTFTKIAFDTETLDTNNNFASSTFTPTVAGYYHVTGIARLPGSMANKTIAPYIFKNGSSYQGFEGIVGGDTGDASMSVSALVYCNGSTDYIDFYVWQNSGGTKTTVTGAVNTSFSGVLVRGA
jgi:hypothetical protein